MIKKFLKKMSDLAASINGSGEASKAAPQQEKAAGNGEPPVEEKNGAPQSLHEPVMDSDNVDPTPRPDHNSSILDNAIDNRDAAVRKIVESFRPATGTKSRDFESLIVYIVYSERPYDPLLHAWADDRFIELLRRALDNALLSAIGAEKITLTAIHTDDLDRQAAKEIVPDTLYVAWQSKKKEMQTERVERAKISLVEGTGSIAQPIYYLSSDAKSKYFIGRGEISRKNNRIRQNDIVINAADENPEVHRLNMCVSSAHADIEVRNGKFLLRAADGGCKSKGGSHTKLIRDGNIVELSETSVLLPLKDNDIIELGKSVCLRFNYI